MSDAAPRPPGFVSASLAIAQKDLRIEGRTKETTLATVLFALVVLVVFAFAFGGDAVQRAGAGTIVPGVVWVTLAFSGIVGFTRSFRLEREDDALAAVALAPVDRGAVFAGKALANFVLLTALETALFPLTSVLLDVPLLAAAAPLALVVPLHTVGLACLGTLFGAVVSRLQRGEALLATLMLPAATPLFLSAVHCTASAIEGTPLAADRHWLLLIGGLDVLYVLVALLLFDAILED
ncbi:MAG TPA: heme exporter protein CcmB [Candidatus Polarisedimenticolaceae bacterium]|nr:heme exporter protein CcmB [Candidatus Polarisedimenticolaceae bacterium]